MLEVVIEAVLDYRTNGNLHVGKEALDRLGHQVSARMADDLHALGRGGHYRHDLTVSLQRIGQIDDFAVHPRGDCLRREGENLPQ